MVRFRIMCTKFDSFSIDFSAHNFKSYFKVSQSQIKEVVCPEKFQVAEFVKTGAS